MAEQSDTPLNIVQGFKGLNNRLQPAALGLSYQLQAVNVLCDDAGYLVRRPGVQSVLSGFKDVYGTRSGRLLAINSSDQLVEINDSAEVSVLASGVTGAPFQWAELGYALFLMSASGQWAVYPDRVIIWGSLCPEPTAIDYPLPEPSSYPPPVGDRITSRRSSMAVSVWEADRDRSVVYFSRADFPHEFRLEKDFLLVPGRVTLMIELAKGVIIGTDRAIYVDPIDAPLERVAEYGVPVGSEAHSDLGFVAFWTDRGLVKATPALENLTDAAVAVDRYAATATGFLPWMGSEYAVVSPSGAALAKRATRPYTPATITTIRRQGVT